MAKAIRSYTKAEQPAVVARRLKNKTGGLGELAAKGWQVWAGKVVEEPIVA